MAAKRFYQAESLISDIVDYVESVYGEAAEAVIRVGWDAEHERGHDSGYYLEVVRRTEDAD